MTTGQEPSATGGSGNTQAGSITWYNPSVLTPYVFDPADQQITRLPSENSLGTTACGGRYLAWTEVSLDDTDARTATLARYR